MKKDSSKVHLGANLSIISQVTGTIDGRAKTYHANLGDVLEDIGVTSVGDNHDRAAEHLTAGSAELDLEGIRAYSSTARKREPLLWNRFPFKWPGGFTPRYILPTHLKGNLTRLRMGRLTLSPW